MSEVKLKIPLAKQKALAAKEGKSLAAWQLETTAKIARMRMVAISSFKLARASNKVNTIEAERFQRKMDSAIS